MGIKKTEGKVVIITGSSRGIGKAIAIACAKKGMKVVLNGRNQERLNETEKEIRIITNDVLSLCLDVSDMKQAAQLIDKTIERFKQIDILVNNVGISSRGEVADMNPEVFKTVFESNVYGTVYPTIPAIPYLRQTKGSLIFISSLAGIRGIPYMSAYCSSKMALRAIAETIRLEEAKNNIHVGLIFVGITDIEHNKEAIGADGSKVILQSRKNKNVQSPEYVANIVLKNISSRKFISVLTGIGKLNSFLQPRFPLLVEKLILKNIKKFDEGIK
ncbi:MAG: SDR family oxidoreductase [Sphingobacteriaceae bacterium]|nr:SDR family oxidoreductase [Sphingobacteriaceae bacterium]